MDLKEAQIAFLKVILGEGNDPPDGVPFGEWMSAKNTLYLATRDESNKDEKTRQALLDEGFVSLQNPEHLELAIRFAVHRIGYAEVLEQIIFHLSYDAGDRGEEGFAPPDVAEAGFKAMRLLREAAEILKQTPPID